MIYEQYDNIYDLIDRMKEHIAIKKKTITKDDAVESNVQGTIDDVASENLRCTIKETQSKE